MESKGCCSMNPPPPSFFAQHAFVARKWENDPACTAPPAPPNSRLVFREFSTTTHTEQLESFGIQTKNHKAFPPIAPAPFLPSLVGKDLMGQKKEEKKQKTRKKADSPPPPAP